MNRPCRVLLYERTHRGQCSPRWPRRRLFPPTRIRAFSFLLPHTSLSLRGSAILAICIRARPRERAHLVRLPLAGGCDPPGTTFYLGRTASRLPESSRTPRPRHSSGLLLPPPSIHLPPFRHRASRREKRVKGLCLALFRRGDFKKAVRLE